MTASPTVVHLVPHLPPQVDGLGDYAAALADALAGQAGIASRFVVGDPAWRGDGRRSAVALAAPNCEALLAALADASTVLLHFVNYGYEPRRGQPWWLLAALERWCAAGGRLVSVLHELYAMGPPWRKAFWYSPGQRRLSARLARLSAARWTSNERYARWVRAKAGDCAVWPVVCNIGEPAAPAPWSARRPALVVFGRAVNRGRSWRLCTPALCARLAIGELHDVGVPIGDADLPAIPGLAVQRHGLLPAAEVSALLAACRVGLVDNEGSPLAKSGVFAAYASHGLLALGERRYPAEDGLTEGATHGCAEAPPAAAEAAAIAARALGWYRGHDRSNLARRAARLIAG